MSIYSKKLQIKKKPVKKTVNILKDIRGIKKEIIIKDECMDIFIRNIYIFAFGFPRSVDQSIFIYALCYKSKL